MMPMTPSGMRTRAISRPFGRVPFGDHRADRDRAGRRCPRAPWPWPRAAPASRVSRSRKAVRAGCSGRRHSRGRAHWPTGCPLRGTAQLRRHRRQRRRSSASLPASARRRAAIAGRLAERIMSASSVAGSRLGSRLIMSVPRRRHCSTMSSRWISSSRPTEAENTCRRSRSALEARVCAAASPAIIGARGRARSRVSFSVMIETASPRMEVGLRPASRRRAAGSCPGAAPSPRPRQRRGGRAARKVPGDPPLARGERSRIRQEPGAARALPRMRFSGCIAWPRRDHHVGSRAERDLGRLDLGHHAAARQCRAGVCRPSPRSPGVIVLDQRQADARRGRFPAARYRARRRRTAAPGRSALIMEATRAASRSLSP